ncbi:hypothetical protein ACFWNT_27605 [Streptomyces sp. NPDC058409]|uniref:hypothetical protein n=1 Tax=Streptomyces sp. NPDC058409 TaxID=3346484 RepID=UPI00365B6897
MTAGIGTAAGTAVAETRDASADPVVISPGARFVPRATIVLNAGETGFLTAQEGDDRLRWIDYATGVTTILDHRLPEPLAYDVDEFRFAKYPSDFGHGSDTVALYAESPTPRVTLQQRADGGSSTTVPIPEGQTYVATYGDTVITRTGDEKAVTDLHLLHLEDGEVRDRKLEGLPEGWTLSISEGDARSVAVRGIKWEDSTMSQGWWVVDLATGSVKALSTRGESVSFDRDTVFHLGAPSNDAAQVYRRDDLDAEPTTVDLRDVASYNDVVRRLGDDFVTVTPPNPGDSEYRGNHLVLRDATGSWKSLLAVASPSVHRTPDGSLLVAGAEENTTYGALDWGVLPLHPRRGRHRHPQAPGGHREPGGQAGRHLAGQRHPHHGRRLAALQPCHHHRRLPEHLADDLRPSGGAELDRRRHRVRPGRRRLQPHLRHLLRVHVRERRRASRPQGRDRAGRHHALPKRRRPVGPEGDLRTQQPATRRPLGPVRCGEPGVRR